MQRSAIQVSSQRCGVFTLTPNIQSIGAGGGLGIAFGLGAVLVPTLLFGLLVAHFGQEVRAHLGLWQPRITRAAAVMLIMLGVATLMGWMAA